MAWYKSKKDNFENPSMSTFFFTTDSQYTLDESGKIKAIPKGWQTSKKDDFVWGVNILPSYKIGNLNIFFNAGVGATHYAKQTINYLEESYVDEGGAVIPAKNVQVETQGQIVSRKSVITSARELELIDNNGEGLELKKSSIDWYINPYITLPAGSGRFYAGFKLYTDGSRIPVKFEYNKAIKDAGLEGGAAASITGLGSLNSKQAQLKWEIPIGLNFYF